MPSRRTLRLVAAAAATAGILAAGLGLGLALGHHGANPAASGSARWPTVPPPIGRASVTAAAPARPAPPPPLRPLRPPAPGPGSVPRMSLADLRWVDFHGVRVPLSATAGPRRAGAASGFADSPLGALLAAAQVTVRLDARFGPAVYRPTVQRQVTGSDAEAALAALDTQYTADRLAAGVPPGAATGPVFVILAGFRWEGYTPGWAVTHLLLQGPGASTDTAYADDRVQLRWQHGDWRVIAPPGGNWDSTVTVVPSAAGYTSWGR